MSSALYHARLRHQREAEKRHPGTLIISGTSYRGAAVTHQEPQLTDHGTVTQQRTLVFSVLQTTIPLTVLRETNGTLKRLQATLQETGHAYILREEWTDPNGPSRKLTLVQAEG